MANTTGGTNATSHQLVEGTLEKAEYTANTGHNPFAVCRRKGGGVLFGDAHVKIGSKFL